MAAKKSVSYYVMVDGCVAGWGDTEKDALEDADGCYEDIAGSGYTEAEVELVKTVKVGRVRRNFVEWK